MSVEIHTSQSTNKEQAAGLTFDQIYPIGSIYISATFSTEAQVEAAFGGTWQAWGAGRVPVGVDTAQTEFNTVEKTGGGKVHSHSQGNMEALIGSPAGNQDALGFAASSSLDLGSTYPSAYSVSGTGHYAPGHPRRAHNTRVLGTTGETSTLQPYIAVYMYKRIS